jgi:hypothetical protein
VVSWHPDTPNEYRNQIVTGDARVLASRLPDESVDMVFTDPPYLKEFIPLYGWLAQEAARVLKPGGYLFAYGAGEHQPEYLRLMQVPGLDYFWVFALLHHGGYPRLWNKRLMSGYKPVFVFTKGKPNTVRWQATVGAVSADKRFHEWGQGDGFPIKTIELLTRPGDVIWEPFCGGGQVPSACVKTGRDYVAFELDPEAAAVARERVRLTPPPLFALETPEPQTVLELAL